MKQLKKAPHLEKEKWIDARDYWYDNVYIKLTTGDELIGIASLDEDYEDDGELMMSLNVDIYHMLKISNEYDTIGWGLYDGSVGVGLHARLIEEIRKLTDEEEEEYVKSGKYPFEELPVIEID